MVENEARVFLVEDSSDDEYFIRRAMCRLFPKIEVEVATDGEEAVRVLLDPEHALPNLVLIDIKLPRLNGHEVLAALRENRTFKNIPLVILTTSVQRSDIDKAYELGANGYVQKAVQFDEYVDKFATLLHYWLSINAN